MHTPDQLYSPSPRPMPHRLPALEYPDRFEVRDVSANGGIRWKRAWVHVSTVCAGEYVGFEEVDDGIWNVCFGPLKLGRFNERHMRLEDEFGRLRRHHVYAMSPDFSVTYVPDRSYFTRGHASGTPLIAGPRPPRSTSRPPGSRAGTASIALCPSAARRLGCRRGTTDQHASQRFGTCT
jgi:hypothetical protein